MSINTSTPSSSITVGPPLYGGTFATPAGDLPFVLPGEQVLPGERILPSEQAAVTPGHPPAILTPSPGRVPPPCIHFTRCGGCAYQHLAEPHQPTLKSQILASLLAPAVPHPLPPIAILAGPPLHYRNRIRVRLRPRPDGTFQPGYSLRGSNDFLPISMCPIAAPLLWQAVSLLTSAHDPRLTRLLAATSELELFENHDGSRLLLTLFLTRPAGPPAAFTAFCETLQALLPQLAGAAAEPGPTLSRSARRALPPLTWGTPGLQYLVAGRPYWVPREAFFQVNRFLLDPFVPTVLGEDHNVLGEDHSPIGEDHDPLGECPNPGPPHDALAWDLYAGVGLFSLPLAQRFARVTAVEGAEPAARALAQLARPGGPAPTLTAVHSATLAFLRARVLDRERPALILADPPRAGLGAEAATLLTRIGAPRLTLVSCDPVTLARDLALLTRDRYRLTALTLVDLFPQTFHLETIAHLTLA